MNLVKLTDECLFNVVRSVVECLGRETTGRLYGISERKRVLATSSYAVQTSEKRRCSVSYGNQSALKRLEKFDLILSGSIGRSRLIGGYHPHKFSEREKEEGFEFEGLGENDLSFIMDEMTRNKMNCWVEVLVNIKRERKYVGEREEYFKVRKYPRRLGVVLNDDKKRAKNMTLSAYLINDNGKVREIRLMNEAVRRKR